MNRDERPVRVGSALAFSQGGESFWVSFRSGRDRCAALDANRGGEVASVLVGPTFRSDGRQRWDVLDGTMSGRSRVGGSGSVQVKAGDRKNVRLHLDATLQAAGTDLLDMGSEGRVRGALSARWCGSRPRHELPTPLGLTSTVGGKQPDSQHVFPVREATIYAHLKDHVIVLSSEGHRCSTGAARNSDIAIELRVSNTTRKVKSADLYGRLMPTRDRDETVSGLEFAIEGALPGGDAVTIVVGGQLVFGGIVVRLQGGAIVQRC